MRASYNPLSVLVPGNPTIIEDAGLIADALVVAAGKDPHWDESAKNFIEGVILHVATDAAYEGNRNLLTVRALIRTAMKLEDENDLDADMEPLAALERAMLDNAELLEAKEDTFDLAGAIEGAARDFFEKEEREQSSVLSTVRRHTKFLDYTAMRSVLTGHDFDLASLKNDPSGITVYLCLPASRMGMCSRWLRIFINQLLDAMERERIVPAAPVLVCLDEFPVLGHMRQLEDAAGQIASFHVKLWVILQDWGQGKALYKERWETFAGNSGILQFFGNNDLATTEYISRRLGKTQIKVTRIGEVGNEQAQQGLEGRSESAEQHDLLTAEEVSRQFARSDRLKRQLVIWAGYNPMMLQRVEYYDETSPVHHVFKGKYAKPFG
jgi:type IV secretion system protein VirD4